MIWQSWSELLARHRSTVIALLLAAMVLGMASARRIDIVHDPFALFASDRPEVAAVQDFWDTFGQDANFMLLLLKPKVGDIYDPAYLGELRRLSERLSAEVPFVAEVRSLANAERLVDTGFELTTVPLLPDGPIDVSAITAFKAAVAELEPVRRTFVGVDGHTTAVQIRFDSSKRTFDDLKPSLAAIRAVVADVPPSIDVTEIGIPVVQERYVTLIERDNRRFAPIVLLIMVVVLYRLLRSWRAVVVPLMAVLVSVAISVGLIAAGPGSFNVVTFVIPTLIMVIGIADAIHLVERYLEERRLGCDISEATRRATIAVGTACLMTSATTAVGFASLLTAHIDVIQEFGLWAAISVGVAFVVTIALVPVGILSLKLPLRGYVEHHEGDAVDRGLKALAEFSQKHPTLVMALWGLFAAVCATGAMQIKRDSTLLEEMFDDDPLVVAQLKAEAAGFAVLPVEVDLIGPPEAFKNPDHLARAAAVQDWLLAHDYVAKAGSFIDVVRETHRALYGTPELFAARPEAVGQAFFLLESAIGDDLWRLVTPDFSRLHISAYRYDKGLNAYNRLYDELSAELARLFAGSGIEARITGSSLVATRAVAQIVEDLLASLSTAFLVIAVLMGLLFRSLRIGLISMVPNMLPLLVAAAVMGWAGFHIRIASGLIFSMALGIAVDDTIHFLARYRNERLAGRNQHDAIVATMRGSGRAMITTSLLLIAGFSVLMTSAFRGIFEFGLLVALVMLVALAADLTLLPALLLRARPFQAAFERSRAHGDGA